MDKTADESMGSVVEVLHRRVGSWRRGWSDFLVAGRIAGAGSRDLSLNPKVLVPESLIPTYYIFDPAR